MRVLSCLLLAVASAAYTYDECAVYGDVCTHVSQVCVDADLQAPWTWYCVCADGRQALATPARCTDGVHGEAVSRVGGATGAPQHFVDYTSAPEYFTNNTYEPADNSTDEYEYLTNSTYEPAEYLSNNTYEPADNSTDEFEYFTNSTYEPAEYLSNNTYEPVDNSTDEFEYFTNNTNGPAEFGDNSTYEPEYVTGNTYEPAVDLVPSVAPEVVHPADAVVPQ